MYSQLLYICKSCWLIHDKHMLSATIRLFRIEYRVDTATAHHRHNINIMSRSQLLYSWVLARQAVNTGWLEIDIHGCYSLAKIAFAPICAFKNNRRIWRHNASISRSRDVTDQLWWRHNAKSEKAVLGDSCEMSDRWWLLAELCARRHKMVCNGVWLRHSWKSLANRLTRYSR